MKELRAHLALAAEFHAEANMSTAALARRARAQALRSADIATKRAQAAMAELAAMSAGKLALATINGRA